MGAPHDPSSTWFVPWSPKASEQQDEDVPSNDRVEDAPWITVYYFPHAGGSAETALSWWTSPQEESSHHNYTIQVVAVPGRGRRMQETPFDRLEDLAQAIARAIHEDCKTPAYMLWGHSFGGLLASRVATLLSKERPPLLLLVSAHPFGNEGSKQTEFYQQPRNSDEDLLNAIAKFGLLQEKDRDLVLSADAEVREFLLAPLKVDLAMAESFQTTDVTTNVPVVVMGGEDDPWCSMDELEHSWNRYSSQRPHAALKFPGGHFYFLDHTDGRVQKGVEDLIQFVLEEEFHWDPAQPNPKLSILAGPRVKYPPQHYRPIHELVERQALETPCRIAIEDGDLQLTYQQSRREAHSLVRLLNMKRGDCVGVALPHCADYILIHWAIFLAGGVIVPMDVGRTASSPLPLVPPTPVACIVTNATHAARIRDVDCRVIQLDRNEKGPCWVASVGDENLIHSSYLPTVSLDDLAYITTTSGTTGKPKVVKSTHRGATICFLAREHVLPYNDADDWREGMNLFFVWECLRPLMFGRTAVIIPDATIFDPGNLVTFLKKERIHRFMINPALMTNMLDQFNIEASVGPQNPAGKSLGEVKHIFLEGEVVPSHLVRSWNRCFPGISVWNIYSTWESLDVSMGNLTEVLAKDDIGGPAPIGTILPNVTCYIVDSYMRIVPKGVSGELAVAGQGISLGYNDINQTSLKFRRSPFISDVNGMEEKKDDDCLSDSESLTSLMYMTGDRAITTEKCTIIKGRIDSQMIKIRAFKVPLDWVEETILRTASFTQVTCVKVIPQLDSSTKQPVALAAYLVFERMSDAERVAATRHIHECLIENLPEYAVPSFYVPLHSLPIKEGSGRKVDLSALPNPTEFSVDLRVQNTSASEHIRQQGKGKAAELIISAMRAVLQNNGIDLDDNFFSCGGHSLRAASLVSLLSRNFGMNLSVVDVYNNPTARQLASFVKGAPERRVRKQRRLSASDTIRSTKNPVEIAIIGVEGRFPGALSVDELWHEVLLKRKTTVREVTKQEMAARGVPASIYNHPSWVSKAYSIEHADKFDASFWGIGKEEALMMDPQHRVFLETAWSAMENAGYAPRSGTPERTGVFAACGIDGYLHHHLKGEGLNDPLDPGSIFLTEIGNEKDYLSSRVSFGLDLLGPSVTVTSACSSGLSAIIQGASSLASMETDLVIAGASSITFPNLGYQFDEGLVGSRDGIVRPFDERANGTVFGDSVGCVVLKRLKDAERDEDNILAVLRGWGQSNDGRQKAGYAAPSAYGQSLAIEDALHMADVDPGSISYIECHATATEIGDGVEIAGILEAYERVGRSAKVSEGRVPKLTALGSVKGNLGHANAAAGLTGFIKTVLVLKERTLVPTANLQKVSSKISYPLMRSSFYVLEEKMPRPYDSRVKMRAGVSSFGIGGSNAHCILEEYNHRQIDKQSMDNQKWRFGELNMLTLSAASETSLRKLMANFSTFLRKSGRKPLSPASVAYTTQVAREHFRYRYCCPFRTLDEASDQLEECLAGTQSRRIVDSRTTKTVAFVFPGQGSQYKCMGKGLFQNNPVFRSSMQCCSDIAKPLIGFDLIRCMYGPDNGRDFTQTVADQMSLFAVEFSMAQLLLTIGLEPVAVCGHSIGEIVAAAISGVMALKDAIELVAVRSTACAKSEVKGLMLAISLPAAKVQELLQGNTWVALINGERDCVVGGDPNAIEHLRSSLSQQGVSTKLLNVSHPFHTPLMTQVGKDVVEELVHMKFDQPKIPITSNVTGRWLKDEICNPEYWAAHLCSTVEWSSNMKCLLSWEPDVIIEVGPGSSLCSLFERNFGDAESPSPRWFRSMRSLRTSADDNYVFIALIADLWCDACTMDFDPLYESRRREILPTYAFAQTSFWKNPQNSIYVEPSRTVIDPGNQKSSQPKNHSCQNEKSCLVPICTPSMPSTNRMYCFAFAGGSWMAFADWKKEGIPLHVIAVDPQRILEKCSHDSGTLTSLLATSIAEDAGPDDQLFFCGLSFGALRAIEVLNKLPKSVKERVSQFFVAGRSPPLNDDSGVDVDFDIEKCVLLPPEIRLSPEWKTFFLPLLMNDLKEDRSAHQRIAALRSKLAKPLLTCDLIVCCGTDDDLFLPADAHRWSQLTSCTTSIEIFDGDHSFLMNQNRDIFNRICKRLSLKINTCPEVEVVPCSYFVQWERCRQEKMSTEENTPEFFFAIVTDAMLHLSLDVEAKLKCNKDSTVVFVQGKGSVDKQAWVTIDILKKIAAADVSTEIIFLFQANADGHLISGLSKCLPFEFPNICCRRSCIQENSKENCLFEKLDCRSLSPVLRPGYEAPYWIQNAVRISHKTKENDLLLKTTKGVRFSSFAPRLQYLQPKVRPERNELETLGHRFAGQHFVISGGTGGIGFALVDWLISDQAVLPEKIVLLSRRNICSRHGERVVMIDDVAQEGHVLQSEGLTKIHDVAGIFHLAGMIEDAIVPNVTFESFQRVKRPKVDFLSSLLDLVVELDWDPEFLCNFSSTSSLFGFPGQTSYCAANSYLDAHAMNGAKCPCPAITINWGPWAEVGMSKVGSKGYQAAVASGDSPLSNDQAFNALSHILCDLEKKQYVVCNVEWEKSLWKDSNLLSHVHQRQPSFSESEHRSSFREKAEPTDSKTPSSCDDDVIAFLRDRLSSWQMDETLVSHGVDSLDIVRMRNAFSKEFGCTAPLSLFMQHDLTVRSLVEELRSILMKS